MRLSPFATFESSRLLRVGAMFWQLTQVFWVGGLWLLHIALLPAMRYAGLAPLLVDEMGDSLGALMVAFSVAGLLAQTLVLVLLQGCSSLWRDARGHLLLIALCAGGMYFAGRLWLPEALRWQLFSYLALAICGLMLVLQAVPDQSARVREAYP